MGEIRIPGAANQIDKIPDSPRKREGEIKQMMCLLQCHMNYESIQDTHGYLPEVMRLKI